MEDIIDIVIKIVATLLAFGVGWLGKYLINFLKSKLSEKNAEKLDMFVAELVAAAEQMYKKEDIDGSIRMRYVQEMLKNAGYEITDAIKALIESKVFEINLTNKVVKASETNESA